MLTIFTYTFMNESRVTDMRPQSAGQTDTDEERFSELEDESEEITPNSAQTDKEVKGQRELLQIEWLEMVFLRR